MSTKQRSSRPGGPHSHFWPGTWRGAEGGASVEEARRIAEQWCAFRGAAWSVRAVSGSGKTATVFIIDTPDGDRALKLYEPSFSQGGEGEVQRVRIDQQLKLKDHDCPSMVSVFDGGIFEDRLFLLMSRALGQELEKRLGAIPRGNIRGIVDQIARAVIFLREKDLCHRDIKGANIFISDDFTHATLLDVSVTRNIYDPVGIGTDHDNQLPIVATARYSPPEYLFRLLDPGQELWHSLDVYQLGALLHDLIMRKPLFQDEYLRSHENRYRFAWIVATVYPEVHAQDVDQDLVFLARRALDKDWSRRSRLCLEDFLADAETRRSHSLQLLGLGGATSLPKADTNNVATVRRRVVEVARELEIGMLDHLRSRNVTARHHRYAGDDDESLRIEFSWTRQDDTAISGSGQVETVLCVELCAAKTGSGVSFRGRATLRTEVGGAPRETEVEMPAVLDGESIQSLILENTVGGLEHLALEIVRAS